MRSERIQNKSGKDSSSCLNIGGQAVLEGVMMKGAKEYAVAVRKADGTIHTELFPYVSLSSRHKFLGLPFIRGIVNFCESLYIGVKTLTYSADISMEDSEEAKEDTRKRDSAKKKESIRKKDSTQKKEDARKEDGTQKKEAGSSAEKAVMIGTVALSIALALGMFILIPSLLASLIATVVRASWVVNLLEGLIRMAIFLGYVLAISRMKDIQRVFQYHGAEHKTINCYESGAALTPENASRCTRINRRCGTSFLFIVMLLSILFFMLVNVQHPLYRILCRLALVPVIASVSYEILKLSNRSQSRLLTALVYPGLLLQRLTTREPDEGQLEVAIASFTKVLDRELSSDGGADAA